jgi:DNA modification methylase
MLTVETWPVDRLIPYARNPRKNDAAVEQMCGAIKEFGFRIPIVARSDGTVVDGHLRLKAAQRLGLADVPVALVDDLSEAQIKAFRLLANRSANWADWDDDLLALEFQDLRDLGFDLGLTGFDAGEIAGFLAEPVVGLTDPDDVPAVPEHSVTRPGDVWVLGSHRLICGDCTDAATVERVLAGVTPHLMVTDPPYGVAYDPSWRNRAGVSASARTGAVLNDHRADWREAWALFPGDVAYVWHAGRYTRTVAESLEAAGFTIRSQIVWAKSRLVLGRGDYHYQHEPCFYAVREGKTGHWQGARDQTTLWSIPSRDQDATTTHGTQKPVECMRRPMLNNSSPGQAVYEPFSGSGTTIIAAETTGRACYAIEISPAYVDVAVTRWQAFTGKDALLDGTDRTFAAIAGERAANTAQDTASADQAATTPPCQQETPHGRTA